MINIKETIVVEGKDDRSAVLAAVDANIICTSGYGMNDKIIDSIRAAYQGPGIIIFTDPDHAGRKIRERLTGLFPGAKHAYLTQLEAEKQGDIGIENAKPESIIKALMNAHAEEFEGDAVISMDDLVSLGLAGASESAKKRELAGAALGIGYANTKTFLKRLRFMGIDILTLEKAVDETCIGELQ